jgi:predicted ATP-dependent serine protease
MHVTWSPRCPSCLSLEGLVASVEAGAPEPPGPTDIPVEGQFVCRSCRQVHSMWAPRCPSCLSLEGLVVASEASLEQPTSMTASTPPPDQDLPTPLRPRLVIARPASPEPELTAPEEELDDLLDGDDAPIPITEIAETSFVRNSTGLPPLDYVLGGGLVEASVVLLASPRGVGKSSLTLQMLAGLGHRCLYVSGEETRVQIAATARRIGALTPQLHVLVERNLAKILAHARKMRAQTIVIDSIQKMTCTVVGGRAGSPGQLKECTAQLVDYAKQNATALWLIGHVTGDGDIAGPKTIEHDVDVVLELSQGTKFEGNERVIRCLDKNRYGPSNLVGYFEMTATGLVPIDLDGWNEEL